MQGMLPNAAEYPVAVSLKRKKRVDDASGEAWNFNFNNGKRNSNQLGNSNNKRALCVRRSGE
jgi:hypothetical protein